MADTGDYMSKYKIFFDEFAATVNPDDQLPVKVAGYYLCEPELIGEIVDWTLQYLNQKNCPPTLVAPLTRIVIEEIRSACKKQPIACGFVSQNNLYQPLKLMQVVTGKVNEVCLRYRDNGRISTLPQPTPGPPTSVCAIKNTRRRMEDRHVIIEDFHSVFDIKDQSPASYYGVFDGHAGTDAAVYSVSHLHQFLAESSYYPTDPVKAIKEAFYRTDTLFIEKSEKENIRSGTTALCALLRPKEKMLYVAWLGDSQALLVRGGQALQVVNPHKPDRQDERERIEEMGGVVLFWGTWRVNGQLAVSRAIGDLDYKPYVTAEPDVKAISLTGKEDFLILACDGLWDFVTEQQAMEAVYQQVKENPGDLEAVSQRLVQLSKSQGSTDNISVIVVFLTSLTQLASRLLDDPVPWVSRLSYFLDTMESSNAGSTNPFTNGSDAAFTQKSGLLLDLGDAFKQNGADLFFLERPANGKGLVDDLGPETDVDSVDDAPLSPNNNGTDLELLRQQTSDFDPVREPRDETPTPPADEVPGVAGLVPDNVAESGEDSEDEWNYYRVEPTDNPDPASEAEPLQQANQPVCQKPVSLPAEEVPSDTDADMESQLNPNAAEFVPSPTQTMPSMEEFLLSQSPMKGLPMENIVVPSNTEFQDEVCLRPGDLNVDDSFSGALNGQESDNVSIGSSDIHDESVPDTIEKVDGVSELSDFINQQNSFKVSPGHLLDESEISTKAEFGDESTTSFMTTGSDFDRLQKSEGLSGNTVSVIESFFTEQECSTTDIVTSNVIESSNLITHTVNSESESFPTDIQPREVLKEPIHISFELQKELAPEMESQPERVQVASDDIGVPFELQETIMEASTDDLFLMEASSDDHLMNTSSTFPDDNSFLQLSEVNETLSPSDKSPNEDFQKIVPSFAEFETSIQEGNSLIPDSDSSSPQLVTVTAVNDIYSPSLAQGLPLSETQSSTPDLLPAHNEPEFPIVEPSPSLNQGLSLSETQSSTPDLLPALNEPELPILEPVFSLDNIMESNKSALQVEESLSSTLPPDSDVNFDIPPALRMCVYPTSEMGPVSSTLPPDLDVNFDDIPPGLGVCEDPMPEMSPVDLEFKKLSEELKQEHVQSPAYELLVEETDLLEPHVVENKPTDHSDDLSLATTEVSRAYSEESKIQAIVTESQEVENVPLDMPVFTKLDQGSEAVSAQVDPFIHDESQKAETETIKDETLIVTQAPHPTPDLTIETADPNLPDIVQKPEILPDAVKTLIEGEEQSKTTESSPDTENEGGLAVTAAAAVAATVATAVAAGAVMADKTEGKKGGTVQLKKIAAVKDKKAVTEKTKPPSRPVGGKSVPNKPLKSTPTSPVKPISSPMSPAPRSSTPKKPAVSTATSKLITKVSTAAPASTLNRPKPATTSPTKPIGIPARPKPTAASLKPRSTATTTVTSTVKTTLTEKKPLSNGDITKTTTKRPELMASRKTVSSTTTTTAKAPTRPTSAPIARATTGKPSSSAASRTTASSATSRTKVTAVNGTTTKPKVPAVPSTVSRTKPATAQAKQANDKQVKETANKQISSHTTTLKSSQTTTRSPSVPSTLKIDSRTATNGKVGVTRTVTSVRSTTTKIGAKKPTAINAPVAKSKIAPTTEHGLSTEQVVTTTDITITEVKSDQSLIDNAQHAE